MIVIFFAILGGLYIQLEKYKKFKKNTEKLDYFLCLLNENKSDIEKLVFSFSKEFFQYDNLVKKNRQIINIPSAGIKMSAMELLTNMYNNAFITSVPEKELRDKFIQKGLEALHLEIIISNSYWKTESDKEYRLLKNPLYWILLFFTKIYETFFSRIPNKFSSVIDGLSAISAILTTIQFGIELMTRNFEVNLIKFFKDLF